MIKFFNQIYGEASDDKEEGEEDEDIIYDAIER